jgi:hypothetical protein
MTLPPITDKQKEILLLLYRFRFLNRIQIQKLLHHKNPKNINVWLKDLTEKEYTGRIYENTREGMIIPAKYYIKKNGIKFLRTQPSIEKSYLPKLHQEDRRTNAFIQKCLLIGDIYLSLVEKLGTSSGFKFYTQSDFPKDGVIRELLPSFAYVREINGEIEHYACEILEEGMDNRKIEGRIKKYISFFSEDEDSGSNIILICPDDNIFRYVNRFTQKYIEDEDMEHLNIHFTTKNRLNEIF